jgi:hypothetical protein
VKKIAISLVPNNRQSIPPFPGPKLNQTHSQIMAIFLDFLPAFSVLMAAALFTAPLCHPILTLSVKIAE